MSKFAKITAALLCLVGAGSAWAQQPQPTQGTVDRLTDAVVEVMPIGRIFDMVAEEDAQWPMHEKPGALSAGQLACVRGELSSAGYRRGKRTEVEAYAQANPSRLDDELKLLESGAATLMGRLVIGGAMAERTGRPFDEKEVFANATNEQAMALVKFMTDPGYSALRKLTGIGDALSPGKSADENEKAGQAVGYSLGAQQVIQAMGTCNVPPSAYM